MKKKYEILRKKTVLYVEDDKELQANTLEVLKNFFNTVLVAVDGDEAYDIFLQNQNKIDIIITDINMPNTDGITLCKYIREFNKDLPIVIISAYTDTDYLLDSINLNIVTYITKPFTTKKVLILLDKFMEYFQLDDYIVLHKELQLNYNRSVLIFENQEIQLTKKEAIFLKLLHNNALVSYEMMYEYIWDYEKSPTEAAMKSFISKFKKKLPLNICKNKKGLGYYLDF